MVLKTGVALEKPGHSCVTKPSSGGTEFLPAAPGDQKEVSVTDPARRQDSCLKQVFRLPSFGLPKLWQRGASLQESMHVA